MKKTILLAALLSLTTTFQINAKERNGHEGGGGDASEERINEIRIDILKWIDNGGARGLVLPRAITYTEYTSKMSKILQPKKVVIGFVEKDDRDNDELKVSVNGTPKTCRGFISAKDSKPHILCNISRFEKTTDSNQYKLIHHEYAGLVNLENNEEASSDYSISTQLTEFLTEQVTLKLAIKKSDKKPIEEVSNCKDFVKKNYVALKTVQSLTGGDSYMDVLSTYADNLHLQIMIAVNLEKMTHEEAEESLKNVLTIRQCANSLGMIFFE